MIIARGKPSVAPGYARNMITSFFPSDLPRTLSEQIRREKRGWLGWLFTQGGKLCVKGEYSTLTRQSHRCYENS